MPLSQISENLTCLLETSFTEINIPQKVLCTNDSIEMDEDKAGMMGNGGAEKNEVETFKHLKKHFRVQLLVQLFRKGYHFSERDFK
jgi:hypothetical protein